MKKAEEGLLMGLGVIAALPFWIAGEKIRRAIVALAGLIAR